MKEVKVIFFALLVALYTSSWWACATIGPSKLWIMPALLTLALAISIFIYCCDHWND